MTEKRVIGVNNRLPWHIPEDFRWFKKYTIGHPVIMGRKTFESIGKPLPGRKNFVITRQLDYRAPGAFICRSLEGAIEKSSGSTKNEIFIIGGESIYKDALKLTNRIYLTLIHKDYRGDSYFPEISDNSFKTIFKEMHKGPIDFTFLIMERVN
jgi:dihydrofolate reductase